MARRVAVDPGKNTGFAFFDGEDLQLSGVAIVDSHIVTKNLFEHIVEYGPQEIVIEDFRIYSWKAQELSWDRMDTPRLIGVLDYLAWEAGIPVIYQPASCKQAFPDARLKRDGYYVSNKHTRDAIRHGLYRMHFGKKEETDNVQEK